MGLFSCLVPSQQQASDRVSQEVQELRLALASAQKHVTQLQADRSQLLHDLASRPVTPSKQDAATEIATVSVAVQVKPPVTMESRIPRPTGEDAKDADGSKAPAKTRIPAPPIAVSAVAVAEATAAAEVQLGRSPLHSPARSPSRSLHNLLSDESMPAAQRAPSAAAGEVVEAPLPAAASPRGVQLAVGALRVPSHPDAAALVSPKAAGSEQQGVAAPAAGTVQRVEVLQQQLKVTEAFRTSLEAELRDARFANTNLQTQMLSLQTKFEKTVEEQLAEVERLMQLRKEGQDAHEQAIQQVHALRHQLELQGQATASAQREAQAAAKHAPEQEQRVQQAEAEVARVREELAGCAAELEQRRVECSELAEQLQAVQQRSQSADVRVLQLQAVAQQADEAHRAAMKQVEDELRGQKAIYDSTVEEMLQLNNNYNELKQSYHQLQSETRSHDEMVQLVQQELSELSYYAAAGRVALGVSPANRGFSSFRTSEVSLGSGGGLPPTPAAAAAAAGGEGTAGELPKGVLVTHGAGLLSDGRVVESAMSSEDDPQEVAAVKAVTALSENSSDAGSAPADLEAEVVPAEGHQGEGASGATASQREAAVAAELQQDEDTAASAAAPGVAGADEQAGETCEADAKA